MAGVANLWYALQMLLHRLPRDTKTQSSSPYGTSPFIREALNDSDPIYYILPGVDGVSEARKLFAEAAIPYWQRARALENLHRRYRSGDQGWRGR